MMKIERWARIRRADTEMAKMTKIFHIINEMRRNNMKIKAIQWLLKLANWMTLEQAYSAVTIFECNDE